MSPMLELLNEMRSARSVAMYVGAVSLSKVADFLRGFDYAVEKVAKQSDPLLGEFCEWIQGKFAPHYYSWEKLILQQSTDDADAVNRFWILLDVFLRERTRGKRLETEPGSTEISAEQLSRRPA